MIWYIVKLVISAGIIVLISELSKKASFTCQFDCLSSTNFSIGYDLDVRGKS